MAVEFFQYQVNKRWYFVNWVIMLVTSLLITGMYIASQAVPSLADYKHTFGLNTPTAILAGIELAYLAIGFWVIKRYSLPFAALIGVMLHIFTLLNGMVSTDPQPGAWAYVIAWLPNIFLSGIYGLPLLVGAIFVTIIYAGIQSQFIPGNLSMPALALFVSGSVIAPLAYLFWRTRFINIEQQKVSQLSGILRSKEQQSAILIESLTDGVVVVNTSGKINLMNPAAAAMTQWSVGEATGVDAPLVVKLHKEDGSEIIAEQDPFTLAFNQNQRSTQVLQLEGREGKKQIVSLSISPIILPGEKRPVGAVAVIRDISEERAEEKQRGEFISTASHEMRTPVAAIEGYLALALNDKVSTIDSRARGFLDKAHTSTQHLGKLFQDLLTSSRAEDGRLSNHPIVIEMSAYLQQLTDDLKFSAEKKGLTAEFIVGGADSTIDATTKDASVQHLLKPLYYVHADPERLREVVTNLFDNACKYTDAGKVSIGLTGNQDVVQLYIRDTGAGIPAEDIPHLFQKFYRVDSSATRTIGGTGLGLFISRKIIELYQGRIWVESEVGKGSTFFINLPRLTSQRAAELQAKEASQTTATPTVANHR